MKDVMRDELGAPKIVDRSIFQAELGLQGQLRYRCVARGVSSATSGGRTIFNNSEPSFLLNPLRIVLYSVAKMTIKTKSMMRRRVNRARPSGLV